MEEKVDEVLQSIENLPKQCLQAWQESVSLLSDGYDVSNVVFCGMGASGLSGQIIQALNVCSKPFVVNSDFQIPSWVDQKSLVILSSYSGNSQEVLSCADQALGRKSTIVGLTTGGKLGEFLGQHGLPSYIFNPINNPSGLPRYGLVYGLTSGLHVLSNLGILEGGSWEKDIEKFQSFSTFEKNDAFEQVAKDQTGHLAGKIIIILAAEHLSGCAHVLANQINESAKQIAVPVSLPEGFHHFFESLKHPEAKVEILLLESNNYQSDTQKRIALIKDRISLNIGLSRESRFGEVLAGLLASGYLSYYLARANGEDPVTTPWVDHFKQELGG